MNEDQLYKRVTLRLIPFLVLLYLIAYIDRSILGFAKLYMNVDVGISDAAYGFGAGLFFLGYILFEVPSNLILVKVGARRWFARIILTWGAITMAMALIQGPTSFYLLRFLPALPLSISPMARRISTSTITSTRDAARKYKPYARLPVYSLIRPIPNGPR